jgi:hypothetical protein
MDILFKGSSGARTKVAPLAIGLGSGIPALVISIELLGYKGKSPELSSIRKVLPK